MEKIEGNIVDIFDKNIFFGTITIFGDRIFDIKKTGVENPEYSYFMPGFVDSHVHIESSLLCPSQFGRLAVTHGTVATISDPHEIANVLGVKGVEYMIEDGDRIPFKFFFGAPSCVPATTFETAGAEITADDIRTLLQNEKIPYLAEMMNFPGVIHENPEVIEKLKIAKELGKPIDGHAPGLRGQEAEKYFAEGISTDHECFTKEEAEEKIKLGVKILIREGSAARNFDELIPLAHEHWYQMMLCSDDKHPDSLLDGHINQLVKRAIAFGIDKFKVFRMASLNPVRHYKLPVGLLKEGDLADFIEVDNPESLNIKATYINGKKVAENGKSLISATLPTVLNNFNTEPLKVEQLAVKYAAGSTQLRVIQAIDGQIVTGSSIEQIEDIEAKDIQKIVVYNRYTQQEPAIAYIQGFGLKEGALASSVAHDSHNIVAVGKDDAAIVDAINLIVREKGGLSVVSETMKGILPLQIAGLMSPKDGYEVANDYIKIDQFAKENLGCKLQSPFMCLSFMALLVIPSLKLSDKGLFDGNKFEFVPLSF